MSYLDIVHFKTPDPLLDWDPQSPFSDAVEHNNPAPPTQPFRKRDWRVSPAEEERIRTQELRRIGESIIQERSSEVDRVIEKIKQELFANPEWGDRLRASSK